MPELLLVMARGHKKSLSIRALGFVLLAMAGIVTGLAWLMLHHVRFWPAAEQQAAQSWQAVPCTVREVGTTTISMRSSSSGRGDAGYSPRVIYTYVINGLERTGHRFWFATTLLNSSAEARAAFGNLRVGDQRICHVNPRNLADAVFDRDARDDRWGWLWFVLIGVAGGGTMILAIHLIIRGPAISP